MSLSRLDHRVILRVQSARRTSSKVRNYFVSLAFIVSKLQSGCIWHLYSCSVTDAFMLYGAKFLLLGLFRCCGFLHISSDVLQDKHPQLVSS